MTETKMLKILIDFADKKDYNAFYLIDVWQKDESKRVREIIKISDIVKEFKEKKGRFYDKFHLNGDFRKLIKHFEKNEELEVKYFYKDTYDSFMKEWKENHPNEKDYSSWVNKMKRKNHRKFIEYMGSLGTFNSPYFLRNNNF